ncbi:MAG: tRNA 2-thiouridine(34) synthase MnmA [Chloroflexota bacterium]|nr:tRNA 2-thiouridine(34) synthase MnmA [Chloroflexota bacterium]
MAKGRVAVAMSGGVDSSVAAALLKEEGYEVFGVTLRLWTLEDPEALPSHRRCCSVEAVDDARRVCQVLGIPFYLLNFEKPFQTHVVDYFCREYEKGRTPNPCLACNQVIKFDLFLRHARALGADYIATGHYARIERCSNYSRLLKAVDPLKDQSYVLFTLSQEELGHLLLPIGHYHKTQVRRLAASWGLPVAEKPDSQEICFIPNGTLHQFLRQRVASQPGDIVDGQGRVLGRYEGLAFYTVGQRRGLGLALGERYYVVGLDPERRLIRVGRDEELLRRNLSATDVHFISGQAPQGPLTVGAKIRYRSPEVPATLWPEADDGARVEFQEPQRAVTPGQAVVFYQGGEVLGGGTIRD